MPQAKLVANHLVRAFGEGEARTVAVRDVSLAIEAGKFSVIVGPSGSGKSTLLALLSGLLAVVLSLLFAGNAHVVAAAVTAATAGVFLRSRRGGFAESGKPS